MQVDELISEPTKKTFMDSYKTKPLQCEFCAYIFQNVVLIPFVRAITTSVKV